MFISEFHQNVIIIAADIMSSMSDKFGSVQFIRKVKTIYGTKKYILSIPDIFRVIKK